MAAKKTATKFAKTSRKPQKAAKAATASPTAAKVAKATASANPYRVGGAYWATVEALRSLGSDEWHSFDAIKAAVRKAMGDGFKSFKSKESRSEETGKDADARIIQNVSVVARRDYGAPLRDQTRTEVRFNGREKVAGIFKL